MMSTLMPFIIGVIVLVVVLLGVLGLIKSFYVKVSQGTALIVNTLASTPKVRFTGALVLPVIHKKEFMKISVITLEINRRGKEGLICQDNLRADITVAFYLRVNETPESVLLVAKSIGADRASDRDAVNQLFNAKFSEALKTVGKKFDFVELFQERADFREQIKTTIGKDLNGYTLEDVAIDYLEQTPKEMLDPDNILDAEGIQKITEQTAAKNIITNEAERNKELAIKKKNVETREATLALERQQADAENRQRREIESTKAREEAETLKVQEEERLKSEQARIQTEQELQVREENKLREVEVAGQNRQRAVAIEIEKVNRARDLEIVSREREVELQRIEKEKALEQERANIANVTRERVAVEKTVAQEEERIKEVREISEAERSKQVQILEAQAEAERDLVRQVKQAEADEQKSKHKAVEINNLAQAELEAAAKKSESQKRLAEGMQAEEAASGLAAARVREVQAAAREKEGLTEARIKTETFIADAKGIEEKGLAEARVIEAQASAKEKEGLVEASIKREMMLSEAKGDEEKGYAAARVIEVQATAKEKEGIVQAEILLRRLKAEAEGLTEKYAAMSTMTDNARGHEEFRLQVSNAFDQAMAAIEANKGIAKEQAAILATALTKTKIDIVGGEGNFFETFAKSLSIGKAIDGAVQKSDLLQGAVNQLMTVANKHLQSKDDKKPTVEE